MTRLITLYVIILGAIKGGRKMKDYAIWAAEKIEKESGLPWGICMLIVTSEHFEGWVKARPEFSVDSYLKEV